MVTPDDAEPVKVRSGAVVGREVEGETILLEVESSMYLGLNRTGTVLWPLMVEGTTKADLVEQLMSAFDIEASRAEADVDAFVEVCQARNLLEP